ncbi:MAG: 16S rRNA (uracil(1498)-N(3))-methyltransferase [Kiritimatiellae bacterium]|nr:16S rRNA (uracil(1498)-N(3))-methyltransferase [Kiritimatiellia bacterium]
MNLILLDPREVGASGRAVLSGARAAHIRDVLKAKPGDTLRVGVLDGPKGSAAVDELDQNTVTLRCELEGRVPPRPEADLLLALPRPKVLRRLWAQLAAIGVGRILLSNAWKVERNYFDTHVLKPETYRPLLIEGLQQAGDTRVPEVTVHKQFKVLVEDELGALFPEGSRLVAQPGVKRSILGAIRLEGAVPPAPRLSPAAGVEPGPPRASRVLLAVGPEGGWTDYELDLLKAHGFQPVGMGERTLRTDTACIALLALVHEALAAW